MEYKILHKTPEAEQLNALRRKVGWSSFDLQDTKKGLENTVFCVSAYNEKDEFIGMARVIGDGYTCFYVEDVMVDPDYQKQGIGFAMLKEIEAYFDSRVIYEENGEKKYRYVIIGLMAAKNRESFYRNFGFIERPNENAGCGMVKIYEKAKNNG